MAGPTPATTQNLRVRGYERATAIECDAKERENPLQVARYKSF